MLTPRWSPLNETEERNSWIDWQSNLCLQCLFQQRFCCYHPWCIRRARQCSFRGRRQHDTYTQDAPLWISPNNWELLDCGVTVLATERERERRRRGRTVSMHIEQVISTSNSVFNQFHLTPCLPRGMAPSPSQIRRPKRGQHHFHCSLGWWSGPKLVQMCQFTVPGKLLSMAIQSQCPSDTDIEQKKQREMNEVGV